MFSKFKMIFKLLNNDWEDYTEEVRRKIGANCAIETINKTVQAREADGSNIGGSYVERVGPSMDCFMRFIDDLFEKTVQETLAKCYDEKIEDIWISTDEHSNNERVNTMNVVKQQLAPTLVAARRKNTSKFSNCWRGCCVQEISKLRCNLHETYRLQLHWSLRR